MIDKNSKKWQEDQALERYRIITPLLDPEIDTKKRNSLRQQISEASGYSTRTLYRWEKAHDENGFTGLKPLSKERRLSSSLPDNFESLIAEAIQLKREVPLRSVSQIIYILEGEGRVAPGVLKRSTVQRHLYDAGYGKKQMKKYSEAKYSSSKRFCKPHRMMLVQGDIKYGICLPIGKNGKKVQTYLSALIDDHSRMILSSDWYDNMEAKIVEDTFHKAILKYGKFDQCYLDNGCQYVAKELHDALSRLSIRFLHAKPYSPSSKGKIEKFNKLVDSFLREAEAKKIKTLEELNLFWHMWVDEFYQNDPHEGISEYYRSQGWEVPEGGITPLQEWNNDSRRLVYLDVSVVAEAFLHHTTRSVDKSGCISMNGVTYEVSTALIGAKVEVSYDPMAMETVTVNYHGMNPIIARPLKISEYCDQKPAIPASMLDVEPKTSRFLDVIAEKYEERKRIQANAISFSSFRKDSPKGGESHV